MFSSPGGPCGLTDTGIDVTHEERRSPHKVDIATMTARPVGNARRLEPRPQFGYSAAVQSLLSSLYRQISRSWSAKQVCNTSVCTPIDLGTITVPAIPAIDGINGIYIPF